jgi:hypothetical protein
MDDVSQPLITISWIVWLLPLLMLWTIPWKAVALWKAARMGSKVWFVVLLLVNTLAILDIIFIFAVAKKPEQTGNNLVK